MFDATHRHPREAGNERMLLEAQPATFRYRLQRMIGRTEGSDQLRRLFDGIDIGHARFELTRDGNLALHVTDRDHADVQIRCFGDDAVFGAKSGLDQMNRAYAAPGFSGHARHGQIAPQRQSRPSDRLGRHHNRGDAGFHIDGAETIQHAFFDITGIRPVAPLLLAVRPAVPVAGVGMAAEHQAGPRTIPLERTNHLMRHVSVVQRNFLKLGYETTRREPVQNPLGDLRFTPNWRRNRDELLGQAHNFCRIYVRERAAYDIHDAGRIAHTSIPTWAPPHNSFTPIVLRVG